MFLLLFPRRLMFLASSVPHLGRLSALTEPIGLDKEPFVLVVGSDPALMLLFSSSRFTEILKQRRKSQILFVF